MKMERKAKSYKLAFKAAVPLLMLAVLFFGCGVLPPVISSISVSPSGKVVAETPVSISAEATSGSGLDLSYAWTASGGSLSSNTGKSIVWTAPTAPGVYIITLTVSDGTNSVTDTVNIVVMDPDAPIIESITIDPNPVATNKEVTLTCAATDPGGETLQYVWSSPTGGTLLSTIGNTVKWRAPSTAGTYGITTTVTNASRLSVSSDSNIQVVVALAPVINSLTAAPSTVVAKGNVDLICDAYDPYGFPLQYKWSPGGGNFTGGEGNTRTWSANGAGTYNPTVQVSNGSASSSTVDVEIIVTAEE